MELEVIPAAITLADYNQYQKLLQPNARLDQYMIAPNTLLGYLAALIPSGDPRQAIRDTSHILRHISCSFFLIGDMKDLQETVFHSKLTISHVSDDYYLITGNLEDWKLAALDLCQRNRTKRTRYLINCCVLYIEKAGLGDVFGNYSKVTQPDQTFILQRKE